MEEQTSKYKELSGRQKRKLKGDECCRQYERDRRQRAAQVIDDYKLSQGCADCGYREHAFVLQFDHLPGKRKLEGVAQLRNRGRLGRALAEMEKCDVVCANCHAVRTHLLRREKPVN